MTQIICELYENQEKRGGSTRQFIGHITIESHFGKEELMRIIQEIEEKTKLEIE